MKYLTAALAFIVLIATLVYAKPIVKNEQELAIRVVKEDRRQRDIREMERQLELTKQDRITGIRSQRRYRVMHRNVEMRVWLIVTHVVTGEFARSMTVENIPTNFPHAGIIAFDNRGSNVWDTIRWYTANDPPQAGTSKPVQAKIESNEEFLANRTADINTNYQHDVFLLIRAAETNSIVEGTFENSSQVIVITVP